MQCIYDNAMSDARSIVRCNLRAINNEWGSLQPPHFSPEISPEFTAITELLEVRQGLRQIDLESEDVDALIMLACMRP